MADSLIEAYHVNYEDRALDYHRAVADAAARPEGARELASRYPGFGLEEILPQSIAFWRKGKNA